MLCTRTERLAVYYKRLANLASRASLVNASAASQSTVLRVDIQASSSAAIISVRLLVLLDLVLLQVGYA